MTNFDTMLFRFFELIDPLLLKFGYEDAATFRDIAHKAFLERFPNFRHSVNGFGGHVSHEGVAEYEALKAWLNSNAIGDYSIAPRDAKHTYAIHFADETDAVMCKMAFNRTLMVRSS